jgi:hypothetical protein
MTALMVSKQTTEVGTSSSTRPSTSLRVLNRKRSQRSASDNDADNRQRGSDAPGMKKCPVLINIRRHYVSRGCVHRNPPLLADKNSFRCEIGHLNSTNDVSILRTPKLCHRDDPSRSHFRLEGARRSVSLLKVAFQEQGESEMENDTVDDELVSSNVDGFMSSKFDEDVRTYTVKFNYYVKVVEIPNRHSYSSKQRKRMWNDGKSIRTNAKRNRIEYDYDGRNWQNAPEEQDFCTLENGRKVHPAFVT